MSKFANTRALFIQAARNVAARVKIVHPRPLVMRLEFADGVHLFTHGAKPDLNSNTVRKMSRDKDLTVRMLKEAGLPTLDAHFVELNRSNFSHEKRIEENKAYQDILQFIQRVGYPIFFKINDGSQGKNVFPVYDESDLRDVITTQLVKKPGAYIAQEAAIGDEYRVVVIHGEIVLAYTRKPLTVIGDGHSSIKDLLHTRLETLQQQGRKVSLKAGSEKVRLHLESIHLNLDVIPQHGAEISVLSNRNLSDGSDPFECTEIIKQKYGQLCRDVYERCGVDYCGLDLIEDTRSGEVKPVILEINSEPGYKHFIRSAPQNPAIVRTVFEHAIAALHLKAQTTRQARRPAIVVITQPTHSPSQQSVLAS